MLYITRREVFSACHRLHNPQLSEEENELLFGKCNNFNGHGHNYILEVTVCGNPDPKSGYVLDLKDLKQIIKKYITDKVDHKNLNLDVDFLSGIIPTTENLAIAFWNQIKDKTGRAKLYSIKIFETENNYIEYKGE